MKVRKMKLRIGTRGSKLALWQANFIKSELLSQFPDLDIQISVIKTKGDKLLDSPLSEIGGKGVFVKEIEESLLNNDIDIAVHSLKDLPSKLPDDLMIGAITKRQHPADATVSKNDVQLEELKPGSKIGTGSLRRKAQILNIYPELEIVPIRGNVDTRIKKLRTENLDAVVLAVAGLQRMGFESEISQIFDPRTIIPAPGQGTIAVESRKDDRNTSKILSNISHLESLSESLLERSFLTQLGGDCNIPAGCYAKISADQISAVGFISDESGKNLIRDEIGGKTEEAEFLGSALADNIIEKGGSEILESIN